MFELLALGAVVFGVYYFYGRQETKNLDVAPLDDRFERALKDVTSDRALFTAIAKATTPDPTGAPPSDEAIKQQIDRMDTATRAAWNSGDPHELSNMAAELRTGLKFDASVDSKKKIATLGAVLRDKIDFLSGQGALVDTFYAKIDKLDIKDGDITKVDPLAMQSIADDVATVDFAALAPYTGLIDENSIASANVIDKNGVNHPVFTKVHLYTLNTSQKIDTPITVEIIRYVKRVVAANGISASVFVGKVTSAVPNEYYGKQIFVFAEADPMDVMSAGTV